MTRQQTEKVANIIIGFAVVGAAYAILRSPSVRRTAWHVARTAIGAAGPWLIAEARQAWERSDGETGDGREMGNRAVSEIEGLVRSEIEGRVPSDVEGPGLSAVARSASDSVGQPHAI